MPDRLPLVSCFLCTTDAPELIFQAVRCFLRQDYHERELLIVDDGPNDLSPGLPADERVKYFRIPAGLNEDGKLSHAISQARGTILAVWSNRHWYGARRLTAQVLPIVNGDADATALEFDLYVEPASWRFFRASTGRRVIDETTVVASRSLWEELAGVTRSGLAESARYHAISGAGLFASIELHPGGSSDLGRQPADEPSWPDEDREFYRGLGTIATPSTRQPLVSCLMLTADRRAFVPHAIRHFLDQDYPERELIVLDDGVEAVEDLIPVDPRIRYVRLSGRNTVGAKRNIGCEQSRGELIAHWDDDDWMAPWRLSYQAAELQRHGADLCGLRRVWFWGPQKNQLWEYFYPHSMQAWVAGGTMMYRRDLWVQRPFSDVSVGEDNLFVWSDYPKKVIELDNHNFYVAMVHPGNTSPKLITPDLWHPRPADEIRNLMGDDFELYAQLAFESATDAPGRLPPSVHFRSPRGPLVSCIMATENRPRFVHQAIRCFLRQTRTNAELIIVDNGRPGVEELTHGLVNVRYVRAPEGMTLGSKLNLGAERARGRILQKLDDDDFYHPTFLEHAVAGLKGADRGRTIVAWDCFLVLLAGDRDVRFSGHGWAAGASLCFYREVWERTQFRDVPSAVDQWFLNDAQAEVRKVCKPELLMVVRHGLNTWSSMNGGGGVDDHFRHAPGCGIPLGELVAPIDRTFYESLARGQVAYE